MGLSKNASAFGLKRKYISGKTQVRLRENVKAFNLKRKCVSPVPYDKENVMIFKLFLYI